METILNHFIFIFTWPQADLEKWLFNFSRFKKNSFVSFNFTKIYPKEEDWNVFIFHYFDSKNYFVVNMADSMADLNGRSFNHHFFKNRFIEKTISLIDIGGLE